MGSCKNSLDLRCEKQKKDRDWVIFLGNVLYYCSNQMLELKVT